MNKIFIQAQKIVRKMPTDTIWNQQSSCMNCVLRILQEVREEPEVSILRPAYAWTGS